MAKYAMSDSGRMYGPEMRALHMSMTPVIVLPEADWRKIVEMARDFDCEYCDDGCGDHPLEKCFSCTIHAIIAKVEADNA